MTSHVLENMNEAITNDFSSTHQAIDIVAEGRGIDDVISASDGVVEMVVKDAKYTDHNTKGTDTYGNFVKIKHPDGKKTLYAHLKYGSIPVSQGQTISKGEKIGTIGATGNAYGAHLHFEVREPDETRNNPNDFLNSPNIVEEAKEQPTPKENEEQPTLNITEIKEENTNTNTNNEIKNEKEENNYTEENNILSNKNYYGPSIVDGLKSIGIDSSFDNRTSIAQKNGILNYRGTYNQNIFLLKLLKQGKLKA